MRGMNNSTGKALDGVQHLKQSISDILTTPIGSRIMQRDYGSTLFELVDRPTSPGFALDVYAATAEALLKWEPRFRLDRIRVVPVQNGVFLDLDGVLIEDGQTITISEVLV